MASGEGELCAEDGTSHKYALEAGGDAHLFIKLGGLREVSFAVEVFHFEHVRAALGGCAHKGGRIQLDEIVLQPERAEAFFESNPHFENFGLLGFAQVYPAVIETHGHLGLLPALEGDDGDG